MKTESHSTRDYSTILSIPFTVLGFLMFVRILEITNTVIFPTIYRLTTPQSFLVYITGDFLTDDLVIVATAVVTSMTLFGRRNIILYIISLTLLILTIFSILSKNIVVADVAALSALPAVLVGYFFSRAKGLSYSTLITKNSLILSTILLFLSIEVVSLFTWLSYPLFPSQIYSGWHWYGADLESRLFYAFGLLSTGLMAILIFSFGLRPAFSSLRQWRNSIIEKGVNQIHANPSEFTLSRRATITILLGSCAAVTLLSIYPYLPSINGDFKSVSVDVPFYINQINLMKERGILAEGGPFDQNVDRAFSLLVFYGIVAVINQPAEHVIPFLSVLLGISLVLSVFSLLRYAVRSIPLAAPIAAIVTAFSIQVVAGIYAGFFSNMLALSITFLTILFLLKYYDRQNRWISLAIFGATLFLVLLIHAYTWVFLAASVLVGTAIFILTSRGSKKDELKLSLPVMIIAVSTIGAVYAIASIANISGITHLSNLLSSSISSDFFAERWFNMNYTFRLYLGGFLTNSALIVLALVWALRSKTCDRFNAIILSSMFITSFFFFFGDTVVQSRMFYNIPLQIPAGIVLASMMSGKNIVSPWRSTRLLLIALVILHFANYGLRSVANFLFL